MLMAWAPGGAPSVCSLPAPPSFGVTPNYPTYSSEPIALPRAAAASAASTVRCRRAARGPAACADREHKPACEPASQARAQGRGRRGEGSCRIPAGR